jgi:hypothetical protein
MCIIEVGAFKKKNIAGQFKQQGGKGKGVSKVPPRCEWAPGTLARAGGAGEGVRHGPRASGLPGVRRCPAARSRGGLFSGRGRLREPGT